jgi:hypothetical protein
LADEFAVVNASLGRVDYEQSRTANHLVIERNGKVLSVCADRPHEPFGRLVYRYGPIDHIELERAASSKRKFGINSRSTTPHTGDDIVFFSAGTLTYYVAIATGQGSGVSLLVFDGKKKIVDLFSGNDCGSDFELGPAEMNFDQAMSPIVQSKEPAHDF